MPTNTKEQKLKLDDIEINKDMQEAVDRFNSEANPDELNKALEISPERDVRITRVIYDAIDEQKGPVKSIDYIMRKLAEYDLNSLELIYAGFHVHSIVNIQRSIISSLERLLS